MQKLHKIVPAMREPLGDNTDPRVADVVTLMTAAIDVLFQQLSPQLRDATILELLDAVDNDGASLLELVNIRADQRLSQQVRNPAEHVLLQQVAAEAALMNLRSWGSIEQQTYRRRSMQVPTDIETVARERLQIAFEAGPRQVAELLDATLDAGTPEQQLATSRLAEAMAAKSIRVDELLTVRGVTQGLHQRIAEFELAVKHAVQPMVIAADDIMREIDRALSRASTLGSVLHGIANDPAPDPLAA